MKKVLVLFCLACIPTLVSADVTTLIARPTLAQIAGEVSGVSAKRNLDRITLYHRTRASSQYRAAAEHVLETLQDYGVPGAEILEYPADGSTMFGTQKSRTAWEVEFAELWEIDAAGKRLQRYASWDAMPLSLAQDSVSGKATALLVDVGAGTSAEDYAGLDISGRLVLTSSQPSAIVEAAVGERGAVGIISYAPNQKSAWWKEDDRLVRWGHLGSFNKTRAFAFMISLGTARQLQARLAAGESIRFNAEVRATQTPGKYALVTALIPGADPTLKAQEIVYSCHLDHPRPGANDNASGCVSILEAARTLAVLIDRGTLPRPLRSLRFIWPAEIEGSLIYLTSRKDTAQIKANIHLDMVGGGEQTKSVFRISGGPMSVPSFVGDVGHEIGHFVNDQTLRYASGEAADFPLVSREGSKNPQLALMEGLSMGSDHDVFNAGSWGIPGIYLHDWPDRYIHTNFDTAAMIDPTKLKRAAFIAAVQGYYLANFGTADVSPLLQLLRGNALQRARAGMQRLAQLDAADRAAVHDVLMQVERGKLASIENFAAIEKPDFAASTAFIDALGEMLAPTEAARQADPRHQRVFRRNPGVQGTMHAFGYSYLEDHRPAGVRTTLQHEVAYEALNLVDGQRTVTDIRDWLLAEFGPVSLPGVAAYLELLEDIDVLK